MSETPKAAATSADVAAAQKAAAESVQKAMGEAAQALNAELAAFAQKANDAGFYVDIQKVFIGDRLVGRVPVVVPVGG